MSTPSDVNTTPQITRFRGTKVCSKWLQERIDDHNIQSNCKYKKWTEHIKVRIQYCVCYACVVTLHDYTTDTNDDMTTMTVIHTEHITHEHLSVPSFVHLVSAYCHIAHCTACLKSELCPSFHSHPHAVFPSTLISLFSSSFTSRTSCRIPSPSSLLKLVEYLCIPAKKVYGLH